MRFEEYTLKTTAYASDRVLIADYQNLDSNGRPTIKGQKQSVIDSGSGSGDMPDQVIGGKAGTFGYNTTPAPFEWDTGTNGRIGRHRFDDTTEEFILYQDKVSSDVSLAGNATIEFHGYAASCTPTTTGKIEVTLRVSSKTSGESWDAAYTTTVSGDLTLKTTQDAIDQFSFTVVASTLGIAANDDVRLKWSRTAPTTQNQSGDYGAVYAALRLPRA